MKDRKQDYDDAKITGFFDKETEINGDLNFKGSFRIDGRFKGKIDSDSMLTIGESGKVEADIKIGYVVIDGEIKGTVQASEKVEVHSNGRVIGSIVSPKLVVEEGAYLEANCQTTDKVLQPRPERPPQEKKETETGPKI
jgi:cytoskeletal protein CcmA (bactofilin family)